ncbi:hypothetical protein N005_06935 [Pseudomonas mediterranea CFBP 5447]|nr:hypothetical protein N005_06935 [Pseudomonas mediterranea CFBP 5447]
MPSSVFYFKQRLPGPLVPGAGSLAQQVLADASVPGVTAFTAHQLAKATLRSDDTFASRLLE